MKEFSVRKYNFNKWIRIIVPIVLLILFIGIIIYVRHFKEHPGLEIFFTMFFTIVSTVPITYMWKTHENRVNAENMFNFIFEELHMLRRKYLAHKVELEKLQEPKVPQGIEHLLDCIRTWENNQEKYFNIFLKHPYFSQKLKQIIFLSFMENYVELRLIVEPINEISKSIENYEKTYANQVQNPDKIEAKNLIDEADKRTFNSLSQAQEQIRIAQPRLDLLNDIIVSFKKKFFGSPFDIKKFAIKAEALHAEYQNIMGIEEKKTSEPKAN